MQRIGKWGLIAAACLAAGVAQGQGTGQKPWYAGASVGQSTARIGEDVNGALGELFGEFSSSIDDNDTGFKVFGGYRALSWLALEASYADYGKAKFNADTRLPLAYVDGNYRTQAFALDVVPFVEFGKFQLFAKAGAAFYETKASSTVFLTGGPQLNESQKATGTAFKWGGGAGYRFTDTIGVRIEYEQFRTGNDDTGKADVSLLSAGIVISF